MPLDTPRTISVPRVRARPSPGCLPGNTHWGGLIPPAAPALSTLTPCHRLVSRAVPA
jgi:hypothetical protein